MSQKRKDSKSWIPGAVISTLLIAAIIYFVDFNEMKTSFEQANYLILLIALPSPFLWMAMRTIVWRTLLRNQASYKDVFWTLSEGYLMNLVLPFRLGEVGKAFLLSRKSTLKFIEIIPTIVIERAVDLGFSAAILLVSLPFVVDSEGASEIGIIMGILVVVGLVTLYVLARNHQWALERFQELSRRWPVLQKIGSGFFEKFFEGLIVLTDGWLFLRFLFWMTLNWALSVLIYYLVARAFFPQAQLFWAFFGLGAAAFGNAVPALPGAIGTFDVAFGGALYKLSGDNPTAASAAVAGRFFKDVAAVVLGSIGLSTEGQTLFGLYHEVREFMAKEES